MSDTLIHLGDSLIQHGPFSDRVYALELAPADMPEVLDELDELAMEEGYGKIVAKGRGADYHEFVSRGYRTEAVVPQLYQNGDDGVFLGKFLDHEREADPEDRRVQEVLKVALAEAGLTGPGGVPEHGEASHGVRKQPPSAVEFREATPDDLVKLATCYRLVFDSYPFPIHDPAHLREERERGTRFFSAWENGDLIAASSMEPGGASGTVEMTDFATLPTHRGRGLASWLLRLMDRAARDTGHRVAYTIARAVSFGMNITFARRSYIFAGTLVNNTQIGGSIESMNVWYKGLGV